jgi:hypothetical protein
MRRRFGESGFANPNDPDAAPWVPLFTPSLPDLTSARVGNYENNNGSVLMDQLWVR